MEPTQLTVTPNVTTEPVAPTLPTKPASENDTAANDTMPASTDLGVDERVAINADLQFLGRASAPVSGTTFRQFNESHPLEAFGAGFGNNEIIALNIHGVSNFGASRNVDPNFSLPGYFEQYPERLKQIQPYMDHPDEAGAVLDYMAQLRNSEQADQLFSKLDEAEHRDRLYASNPLAYILGAGLGIGADIAGALLLDIGSGGVATPEVLAALSRIGIGRIPAIAGEAAVFGGLDTLAFSAGQAANDPRIGMKDVGFNTLLGVLAGGGIGALAAKIGGKGALLSSTPLGEGAVGASGVRVVEDVTAKSAGAAVAPGVRTSTNVPAAWSGSFFSRIFGEGVIAHAIRSPIAMVTDRGARGVTEAASGLTGNRRWFDELSRIVRITTAMKGEIGGKAARDAAVETRLAQFSDKAVARNLEQDREFSTMLGDVFGNGTTMGKVASAWQRKQFPSREFGRMVNEWRYAKANGMTDQLDAILDSSPVKLNDAQRVAMARNLDVSAAGEDRFWKGFEDLQTALGRLSEKDKIPGYSPQIWNREAILSDPEGFKQVLREVLSREPSVEFINKVAPGHLAEGETFSDLLKREPELANELLDDWSRGVIDDAVEAREVVVDRVNTERKLVVGELATDIEDRLQTNIAVAQKKIARLEREAAKNPDDVTIAAKIENVQRRLDEETQKLTHLRRAQRNADDLERFVTASKIGDRALKAALAKSQRAETRAINAAAREQARLLAREEIDRLFSNLIGDTKNPLGFISDELAGTSGRFKNRTLELGRARFGAARRFLTNDAHILRTSFVRSAGPDLAFRSVFQRAGDEVLSTPDLLKSIRAAALEGFDDDARKLSGAALNKVLADKQAAGRLFDDVTKGFFIENLVPGGEVGRAFNTYASTAQALTASIVLGNQAISQITDPLIAIFASRGIGRSLRTFASNRQLLRELQALGQTDLEVLVRGGDMLEMGRFLAFTDLDNAAIAAGESWAKKIARGARNAATAEGWANFATGMSRMVRRGFGGYFIRQIDEDLMNFANLSSSMRTYYGRLGINAEIASEMTEMMNRSHLSLLEGKLRVPDTAAWARERPDLLQRWTDAFREAGKEAMLTPGVADRPFFSRTPMGRLTLQFTSFMHTAGNRFVRPLVQELRLHPSNVAAWTVVLGSGVLAAMVTAGRAASRGQLDEWKDDWSTPDGLRKRIFEMVLATPFLAGSSAMIVTAFIKSPFSRMINDLVEQATGTRPLPEASSRYAELTGSGLLTGPAVSTLITLAHSIATDVLSGDFQGAEETLMAKLPILNSFYFQIGAHAMKLYERDQ